MGPCPREEGKKKGLLILREGWGEGKHLQPPKKDGKKRVFGRPEEGRKGGIDASLGRGGREKEEGRRHRLPQVKRGKRGKTGSRPFDRERERKRIFPI